MRGREPSKFQVSAGLMGQGVGVERASVYAMPQILLGVPARELGFPNSSQHQLLAKGHPGGGKLPGISGSPRVRAEWFQLV